MKKITLALFVLMYTLGFSQSAPTTFEAGEIGSAWSFTNFDNGTDSSVGYEKVANPNVSGINTSATVGKFTAVATGAAQAGCQSNDIGKFTLSTTNSTVKIMVYKTEISDVALKFEVAGGGSLGEIKVANTKINEWEELTFDFYGQIGKLESTDIVKIRISLDYKARTVDKVSYFDNLTFSKSTVVSPKIPCDAVFKDAQQGTSFDVGYKAKFETTGTDVAVTFELLDQKDGVIAYLWRESPFAEYPMANQGGKVFKYTLTGQTSGSIITYACKFAFAGGAAVTKYFKYTVGDSCGTETTSTVPTLPLDFESTTTAYTFVDFDGGAVTKIANPDKTGVNTSATVAKMVKGAGQPWGGSKIKMASAVDFSTKKLFKIKVWSPVAGKKLLLKFEGAGAAFEKESIGVTTANAWQELSFDFTGVAVNNLNDNIVFIFDLGTAGDGSANSTYYFDDVSQSAVAVVSTAPTLPLDFESTTTAYTFVDFDGGAVTKIANPDKTGVNTSATVAKMVKGAGQPWGGSKIKMASAVDFSTKKLFKIKVWSPVAGKKLLLKFEGAGAAFEKESIGVTTANAWQELSFDFTGVAVNNLNDNIVFIFDLGTAGDGSANSTYYFDDVSQSAVAVGSTSTTVTIDGSSVLTGYLNWFNKDGSYASGGAWALADVKTISDATADTVSLSPNFNTYNATDSYWSDGAGKGNKIIEGNSFIENSALASQILTFNGDVVSNTLAVGYTAIAFIKGLDPNNGYTDVLGITAPLVAGQSFSITTGTAISAGLIVQYGFTVRGLNGNPADEAALGKVVIGKSTLGTSKFEVSNVKMYPNPVSNELTIEAKNTIQKVEVFNLLGQQVLSINPKTNSAKIQTSSLSKGVYVITATIDDVVSSSKFIKQ
jgi:hypothetical protein